MPEEQSESHRLANTISELLYAVAGWMLVGLGALGIIVQMGYIVGDPMLADPVVTPVVVLISVVLVLFGVFVNPRFRRRLDRRHALTRFGRTRSVDERVLHSEEGRTDRCVVCGSRLHQGLARRYREEVCIAGIPVLTRSEERNYYCADCATTEFENAPGDTVVEADDEPEQSPRPAMERR